MATFWDRIAGLYDLAGRCNRRANAEAVRRVAAEISPGARVLDCAAGTGKFSLAAAERAEKVLCTDLSEAMLDRAFLKAKRLGRTNLAFEVRDLLCLPDRDGAFDAVIAANVLHLLSRPEQAVAELWRVVRPGGKLILPTYLQGEAGPGFRFLIRLYRLAGFSPKVQFTLGGYETFLRRCGLPEAALTRIEGWLPVGLAVLTKPATI